MARLPKFNSFEQVVRHTIQSKGFMRKRVSRLESPLPGIKGGPKLAEMKGKMLADLDKALGHDSALDSSYFISETGQLPSPMGVPSVANVENVNQQHVRWIGDAIYQFCRQLHYGRREVRNFSVNKVSTVGGPYMKSGDEGALIRLAYVYMYAAFAGTIKERLTIMDWQALLGGRDDLLPIVPIMTVGYRMMAQRLADFSIQGDSLSSIKFRRREVMDALGHYRIMDMAVSHSKIAQAMRARSINQVGACTNLLGAIAEDPFRNAYYKDNAVFHTPDVQAAVRDSYIDFRDDDSEDDPVELRSYDFSGMEKSETYHLAAFRYKAMRDAGCPEWFVNLAMANRYSPYILTDDDPKRPTLLAPQLKGSWASGKIDFSLDLGRRSGEWDTDTGNKDFGGGVYTKALWQVGGLGPNIPKTSFEACVAHPLFRRFYMQGRRVPGATATMVADMGDDVLLLGKASTLRKVDNFLLSLSPTVKIVREPVTQYIGNEVTKEMHTIDAYPYLGRFLSNMLAPERPWDSRMRRDHIALSIYARLQHASNAPLFSVYKSILDSRMIEYYGFTCDDIYKRFSLAEAEGPQALSIADMIFLHDPTSIQWGRISVNDVSPDLLKSTNIYLNIPAELVDFIYTQESNT